MMQQRQVMTAALGVTLVVIAGWSARGAEKEKSFPKGSEKAVAAVRKEFPRAKIDEVAEPKGFGGSGGKGTPLFWTVRFHTGDQKHDLSVIPDGTIIRLPVSLKARDLPKPVADAVARAEPGATVQSAVKNEMRATLKYVALDRAQVLQYAIEVVKDRKRSRVTMNAQGGNVKVTELKEEKKAAKDQSARAGDAEKEIKIPAKAARAVKAIKALYPDAIVKDITTEVFDDGSGTIEILTYEVEFLSKGKKHEMVASPEGIIPHLWASVERKALPKAVKDALTKAVPGAEVKQARALEIRASLRFVARDKPKVYYTIRVAKNGKEKTINVKPDGSLVKRATFPRK
jgi:hypothetical protein